MCKCKVLNYYVFFSLMRVIKQEFWILYYLLIPSQGTIRGCQWILPLLPHLSKKCSGNNGIFFQILVWGHNLFSHEFTAVVLLEKKSLSARSACLLNCRFMVIHPQKVSELERKVRKLDQSRDIFYTRVPWHNWCFLFLEQQCLIPLQQLLLVYMLYIWFHKLEKTPHWPSLPALCFKAGSY